MIDVLTDAVAAAQNLLGQKLVYVSPDGRVGGYIVETEAYTQEDPASHAFRGPTKSNAPMFGPAGTVYVYFTYGMHYCFNIVTGQAGHGQGVLIRALEPVEGLDIMMRNRGTDQVRELTSGPAKAAQALGITRQLSGIHLNDGVLVLEKGFTPEEIVQTTRVGISKAVDQPWRFFIKDNQFVSKPIKR